MFPQGQLQCLNVVMKDLYIVEVTSVNSKVWKRQIDQLFVTEGIDSDYDHPGIE